MLFRTTILTLLSAATAAVVPNLTPTNHNPKARQLGDIEAGMVMSGEIPTAGGTIAGLQLRVTSSGASTLTKRCGANNVECNYSGMYHGGNKSCEILSMGIRYAQNIVLPLSPRSICMQVNGDRRCCVSWSQDTDISNVQILWPALIKTRNSCASANSNPFSGLARDVSLSGVCLTQCYSERRMGVIED